MFTVHIIEDGEGVGAEKIAADNAAAAIIHAWANFFGLAMENGQAVPAKIEININEDDDWAEIIVQFNETDSVVFQLIAEVL